MEPNEARVVARRALLPYPGVIKVGPDRSRASLG